MPLSSLGKNIFLSLVVKSPNQIESPCRCPKLMSVSKSSHSDTQLNDRKAGSLKDEKDSLWLLFIYLKKENISNFKEPNIWIRYSGNESALISRLKIQPWPLCYWHRRVNSIDRSKNRTDKISSKRKYKMKRKNNNFCLFVQWQERKNLIKIRYKKKTSNNKTGKT